jgi:hypothetical protein
VVEVGDGVPLDFALHPSYPNPFNASAAIAFDLPRPGMARLTVYDVLGRPVRRVAAHWLEAGSYVRRWDGRDDGGRPAASGVYVYRLQAGKLQATGRMLLIR